jgi:succinate dehydrogenase/fumarate reductase flavoprotein subunit
VRIVPGSLGTFAGLKTDQHARVLDRQGAPIGGLYAAGNDMNSIMGGHYPGGGITLGPAMTFGWIAACHIAARRQNNQRKPMPIPPMSQPEEVDLLVFGGGAGGMTAALVASLEGLDVLLCEKTGQVGGTTATSGGTTWVPGTDLSFRAGVPDSSIDAAAFLASVVGQRGNEALRQAFWNPARPRSMNWNSTQKPNSWPLPPIPTIWATTPARPLAGGRWRHCPSTGGGWARISRGYGHRAPNSWAPPA